MDHADAEQQLIEQALGLEDADPGVDADQERGPERQDDQHQQGRPQRRRGAGHAVGDRIADQQGQGRGDGGDDDAGDIGVEIERILREPDIVVEAQLLEAGDETRDAVPETQHRRIRRHGNRRGRQRDLEDNDEGDEEEEQQPEVGHDDDQPADDGLGQAGKRGFPDRGFRASNCQCGVRHRRTYRVSTTPASGRKEIQARSSQVSGSSTARVAFMALARTICPSSSLTW